MCVFTISSLFSFLSFSVKTKEKWLKQDISLKKNTYLLTE